MIKNNSVLLINPWIYHFTGYDYWFKPVGLLTIGSFLRENGYGIDLIDCLDRFHPALDALPEKERPLCREYGTGRFIREIVKKPEILSHIPRHFSRYGLPEALFLQELEKREQPSAVLVTSGMTYWYLGAFHAIELVKQKWPDVPVILGGIYASLCKSHAERHSKADFVVAGPGEMTALSLVDSFCNFSREYAACSWKEGDFPYPALDLYRQILAAPIITSRGCPFRCPFCATYVLAPRFEQRSPQKVVAEIEHYANKYQVTNFVFWDDALLVNPEQHIKIILRLVLEKKIQTTFHLPNGVHPHFIDWELASLLWECNFKTVRMSFESSDQERQNWMGNKVSNEDLEKAVDNLSKAGFQRKALDAYLLMGLPEQSFAEVEKSIYFVHRLGITIRLSTYSPIPGTLEWEQASRQIGLPEDFDPLLTNNSFYPLHRSSDDIQKLDELRLLAKNLNASL